MWIATTSARCTGSSTRADKAIDRYLFPESFRRCRIRKAGWILMTLLATIIAQHAALVLSTLRPAA